MGNAQSPVRLKGRMAKFEFTNNWFDATARAAWDHLIPQILPKKILEVGSYEGASACYLIQKLAPKLELEIHCIDTWLGGREHANEDMKSVESRFQSNI